MSHQAFHRFFRLEKTPGFSREVILRQIVPNLLLVVLAAAMSALLFPPYECWWGAWFALIPLLVALRRTGRGSAASWLMLLYGLLFFAVSLPWITRIFQIGALGAYLLMALPLVPFGFCYRLLSVQGRPWMTVVLAASAWVALDWVRCEGWYFQFSWLQLGSVFAACKNVGTLYPYLGMYGVTFLLVVVNALAVEIIIARSPWKTRLGQLVACAVPVLAFSLYLNQPAPIPNDGSTPTFRALLVQSEMGSLRELAHATRAQQSSHAKLIVWPEYAIVAYPLSDQKLMTELSQIARDMDATLVLGCKEHVPAVTRCDWMRRRGMMIADGELFANTALVIDPRGRLIGKYHKTHPIQFFADGVPGTTFPTFSTPIGRIGLAICYDFDYAGTARRLVANGAQVLVVPTFDADDWTAQQHLQHARIAQVRAAEVGRWVVRTTSSGVSQIISPLGQNTVVIGDHVVATAVGEAMATGTMTLYTRYTHHLPQLALVLFIIWLLASAVIAQRKRGESHPQPDYPPNVVAP